MFYTIFLIIILFIVAILTLYLFSSVLGFLVTKMPFVTTPKQNIEFLAKKINLNSQDVFLELGSGYGQTLFLLSEKYSVTGIGVEFSFWAHALAKCLQIYKRANIKFILGDFLKQDWSKATVVYSYLFPVIMARVEQKFLTECKKGTKFVARDFGLPNLAADQVYELPNKHCFFLYIKR